MTHQYELMVILSPEIDERQVAPTLDKFLKVITNDGGSIDNVDIWGQAAVLRMRSRRRTRASTPSSTSLRPALPLRSSTAS